MDIVVVGSCMIDLVSYVSRLPQKGETIHGHKFMTGFGGKGANQCIAASKLGAKTAMIAKVGADDFGEKYIKHFNENNVFNDFVGKSPDNSTGMASISVSDDGSNCIIIVAGANMKLMISDIDKAEQLIATSKMLACQLEIDPLVTMHALKIAHKNNVKTFLNFAPAVASFDREIFKYVDFFCLNETEAEIFSGLAVHDITEALIALDHIFEITAACVILTLGEKGVVYKLNGNEGKHIPCEKVKTLDTTGAGDVFIGALMSFITNDNCRDAATKLFSECLNDTSNNNLTDAKADEKHNLFNDFNNAINFACKVASNSVQKLGTQTSFPTLKEILEQQIV